MLKYPEAMRQVECVYQEKEIGLRFSRTIGAIPLMCTIDISWRVYGWYVYTALHMDINEEEFKNHITQILILKQWPLVPRSSLPSEVLHSIFILLRSLGSRLGWAELLTSWSPLVNLALWTEKYTCVLSGQDHKPLKCGPVQTMFQNI